MKNTVLKFGLISCAIMIVFMGVGWFGMSGESDYDLGMIIGFAGMFIAFSMIFFATVKERKRRGGKISFKSAFGIGLTITLMVSVLYVASWVILTVVKPDVMTALNEMQITHYKDSGLSADEIAKKIAQWEVDFKSYQDSILVRIGYTAMEIFPVGLILALISSLILSTIFKKKSLDIGTLDDQVS